MRHGEDSYAAEQVAHHRPPPRQPGWGLSKPSGPGLGWSVALIPLLALVAYAPGVRNEFVHWDDVPYILSNPHFRSTEGLWRIWFTLESPQYYPLTFSSYWVEHQIWGAWPTGYFLTNLLLHAANSLLVCLLARALGAGRSVAWLAGALFALHPIQVASVAWLAQRKNVLSGIFFLLTFLSYWRYCRRGNAALYLASLLAFACALLSKTAAVTLPVSLMLAEWLLLRRRGWAPLRRVLPMLLLALVLGAVTIFQERAVAPATADAAPQPLAAAAALWVYLGKVLWPGTLLALYPPWQVTAASAAWWLPAAGLVAAVFAVWYWRRPLGDLPVWGLSHFCLTLLPALGLVPFAYLLSAPIGDHFAYLALPGLFLALLCVAEGLAKRWGASVARTTVTSTIAGGVLLALGLKTWNQVSVWRDGVQLWSHTLAHNPGSPVAHNNLGVALAEQDQLEEALFSYRQAARLKPDYWMARTNIGTALRNLGRLDEAVTEFRSIVADAPQDAAAHFNLADTLVGQGRRPEAWAEYAEAVRLDPTFAEAYTNWGVALVEAGSHQEAITRLQAALELNPDDAVAHFNLGLTLATQGDLQRAAFHYHQALRLKPESPRLYTNLGLLSAAQGQLPDAARYLRRALELDPNDALAHLNLGTLAAQAGRPQDAAAHFRAALRIEPASVEANSNLGTLLAQHGEFEGSIRYLAEAVRLRPDHANAHFMLGWARAAQGRFDQAIPHYARVIEIQPTDAEAHEQLAAAYAATGRSAAAVETAARALELAREAGDEALAGRIEARLAQYRTSTSSPAASQAVEP